MRLVLLLDPSQPPMVVPAALVVVLDDQGVAVGIASDRGYPATMVTAADKPDFNEELRNEQVQAVLRAVNIPLRRVDCTVINPSKVK